LTFHTVLSEGALPTASRNRWQEFWASWPDQQLLPNCPRFQSGPSKLRL